MIWLGVCVVLYTLVALAQIALAPDALVLGGFL